MEEEGKRIEKEVRREGEKSKGVEKEMERR